MRLSRLFTYLLFISWFYSCGIPIGQLRPIPEEVLPPVQPIFDSDESELAFDMSLKVFKKYNSGVLAIKRDETKPESYRAVFMAKAGVNLFDFSFTKDSLMVQKIIPQLDKKNIIKILEQDLRLIFDPPALDEIHFFQKRGTGELVRQGEKEKCVYSDYFDREGKVYRTDKGTTRTSFIRMELNYDDLNHLSELEIKHKKIPLTLRLKRITL